MKRILAIGIAVAVLVLSLSTVALAGTVQPAATPPCDALDYTEYYDANTIIARVHVCAGMTSKYSYTTNKGVSVESMRKDTFPSGGSLSLGFVTQKGTSTGASITLTAASGSREIKTFMNYALEHWAHVEPYSAPLKDGTAVTPESLPPGVVTARWDIIKVNGYSGAPLTTGNSLTGDNAPASELSAYEGQVHPIYGKVWPASPNGTWTTAYISGGNLGIGASVAGFSLNCKSYYDSNVSLEHTFSTDYTRYWGYDRNTGGKEWFFSHS